MKNFTILSLILALSASSAFANNIHVLSNASLKRIFPNSSINFPAPANDLIYFGGPVISKVKVVTVFWGNNVAPEVKNNVEDFYKSLVTSSFMDAGKEYSTTNLTGQNGQQGSNQVIGRGTYGQTVQIVPASALNKSKVDDTEIQKELERQVATGQLPAPTADTLYMIHFSGGITITMDDGNGGLASSCQQFCAYHNGFKSKAGANIYYGAMPELSGFACSMGCGSGSLLDRTTTSASHELMEAVTDPFPTPGSHPAFPQAWNTSGGEEISDLCQSAPSGKLIGSAKSYLVTQNYLNSTHACSTAKTYK